MHLALKLHPDFRCAAVSRIDVDVARPVPGELALRYAVTGKIADLRLAPAAAPMRTDELWKHTCFEAFVRPVPGDGYHEFNFAPSTQWAAYRFNAYRGGMNVADEISAPRITVLAADDRYEMQVVVEAPSLSDNAAWRLGLAVVIEETSGAISYWALAHPPGKADFHHSDTFAHDLSAAGWT